MGKVFISCLKSANNRNLQVLIAFRKYILYWGFFEMRDREAATTRGCRLGYTDTLNNEFNWDAITRIFNVKISREAGKKSRILPITPGKISDPKSDTVIKALVLETLAWSFA